MSKSSAWPTLIAIAGSLITLLLCPGVLLGQPRIDYHLDFSHLETQGLRIQLEGSEFPPGDLIFLVPQVDKPGHRQSAFSSFLLANSSEQPVVLEQAEQELTFQIPDSHAFQLSYSFHPGKLRTLAGPFFYDDKRCLLRLEKLLIVPELVVQKRVFFDSLHEGWKVLGGSPGEKQHQVQWNEPGDRPIYLGVVNWNETRIAGFDLSLAMEGIQEDFPSSWQEVFKGQLQVFARFSKRKVPRKLMVVGLKPEKKGKLFPESCLSWGAGLILISPEMTASLPPGNEARNFQREVAGAIVPWYFPALAGSPASRFLGEIREYFGWKVLLKIGALRHEVFLEQMAIGVKTIPSGVSTTVNREAGKPEAPAETAVLARISGPTRFFFVDLWLEFFGRDNQSLPELLLKSSNPSGRGSLHLEPWLLRLRQERRLAKSIEQLFIEDSPLLLPELVRPFGLIYFQRSLPDWGFGLDESLCVTALKSGLKTSLQAGDRLLSIDHVAISHPYDLIRLGSHFQAGKTLTLQVERQGIGLWLKHPVGRLFYSRFESNRLSDVDKQEKMDRFLAKGKSEF